MKPIIVSNRNDFTLKKCKSDGIFTTLNYTNYFASILTGSLRNKEVRSFKDLLHQLGIERVIFNDNATIVYLTTGEKGVAIRSQNEEFDPVIGLSVAYALAESGTSKKKFKELVNKAYKKGGKK